MGFYAQKKSQTAIVTSVNVDDLEIGKDEDVVNIKGTKVLLSGIGFYCGEEDGCVLIGNYQEWLAGGGGIQIPIITRWKEDAIV